MIISGQLMRFFMLLVLALSLLVTVVPSTAFAGADSCLENDYSPDLGCRDVMDWSAMCGTYGHDIIDYNQNYGYECRNSQCSSLVFSPSLYWALLADPGARSSYPSNYRPVNETCPATCQSLGYQAGTPPSCYNLVPDLVAGNTSGSATAGSGTTITGSVSNIGNGGTGGGFATLLQIDDDNSLTDWEMYAQVNGSSVGSNLAAGASASISGSYVFPSAGVWYTRMCVDLPPVWNGVIAESNEGNNCGNWTPITVEYAGACYASPDGTTVAYNATSHQITAYNVSPSATSVQFPTWTDVSGQDDIVWYNGTNQGNGTWTTTVNPNNHSGYGSVSVHVYRNGVFCDTASFTKNYPIPAQPAGLSAVCNAAGTSVTFSWGAVANATGYYFRNDDQQISSCGSWYCQTPPDVITDPIAQTSYTINGTVPGHVNSWWVHSINASGYSGATYSSITCSGQSDLTATNLTPNAGSSFTTGTPVSLTGRVTNAGLGAAANIPNIFQVCDSTCTSLNTNVAATTIAALAAGANNSSVSGSYTFATPGSYQYRMCADVNTSWVSGNTESNEGNNCDAWRTLTISAPLPTCSNGVDDDGDGFTDYPADTGCSSASDSTDSPNVPTASLSASPGTISSGGSSTLTWSSTGATSCTGTGFTAGGTSGTRSVSPVTPGANSYSMTCSGPGGTSVPALATVNVLIPTAYITAQPTLVKSGSSASLLWSATEATSCTITPYHGTTALAPIFSGAPAVGTTTTTATNITRQTDYQLSCQTISGGNISSTVQVNLRFDADEF